MKKVIKISGTFLFIGTIVTAIATKVVNNKKKNPEDTTYESPEYAKEFDEKYNLFDIMKMIEGLDEIPYPDDSECTYTLAVAQTFAQYMRAASYADTCGRGYIIQDLSHLFDMIIENQSLDDESKYPLETIIPEYKHKAIVLKELCDKCQTGGV